MLSFEERLALCDLTEDEIAAIAEHEHIAVRAALELGRYLVQRPSGVQGIKRMIVDDIEQAKGHLDFDRVLLLKATFKHFIDSHPGNPANCQTAAKSGT